MANELNFDLQLPVSPNKDVDPLTQRELVIVYNSIRRLAEQVGGGEMLDWVDYSASSIILGWGTILSKQIKYRYLNLNTVFVTFLIQGTSNTTVANFTLPFDIQEPIYTPLGLTEDNGSILTSPGQINSIGGLNVINLYKDLAQTSWTASGTKVVAGQFICRV